MAVERQIIGRRPISWAVVFTKSFCALPFFQKSFISTPTNAIDIPTNVFMSSFEIKNLENFQLGYRVEIVKKCAVLVSNMTGKAYFIHNKC